MILISGLFGGACKKLNLNLIPHLEASNLAIYSVNLLKMILINIYSTFDFKLLPNAILNQTKIGNTQNGGS